MVVHSSAVTSWKIVKPACQRKYGRGISYEMKNKSKLSGSEVYYTNSLILVIEIMLCSKLHRQKDSNLIFVAYKIQAK